MTSEIKPQIMKIGQRFVLCDAEIAAELTEDLFCPEKLKDKNLLTGQALGRGQAWFIKYHEYNWVLRHFRRGGLIGHFNADRYFGWSLENSRSWREWRLLAELYQRGLPVPRPIAAAVQGRCGCYRADLLTELIPDAKTLAGSLSEKSQSAKFWCNLGTCLRRFHEQGVYHADLNANNILIDAGLEIYLIDFDRGEIRSPGAWAIQNLERLKRSLLKIKANSSDFHFNDEDWTQLLSGYATTC